MKRFGRFRLRQRAVLRITTISSYGTSLKLALLNGGTLLMTLVFVSMFVIIFSAIAGLVNRTYHESILQAQDETAFQIAESGLNFARWRLAHDPDNYAAAVSTVDDQFAGNLGQYDLTFTAPDPGSTVVMITSVGVTATQPGRSVTLRARYGRPSLARFASITNSDVWYGGIISGAVHSNGGIRMDGTSDSLMTSAQELYACQPHHGCSSPFETKNGVWGTGTTQELWEFPASSVDYTTLTTDLIAMKTAAENSNTYYGSNNGYGYQITFNTNNTYTIAKVKSLGPNIQSWRSETGWLNTSHDVGTTTPIETRAVPSNGVIFTEATAWVRGDIRDRVTVAAGVFPDTPSTNVDIILNGDISYGGVRDGTRVFAAVAQRNILIPWSGAPDIMDLDGAFIAQKGSFHRRYYPNCCGAQAHRLKSQLIRFGMIASNGVPATAWVNSSQQVISGFQSGSASYDPKLLYGPPPYFPVSGQYEFISWEEQQ